ncbi:MAG: sulfotransferase domain-containing protein [Gemmatimonadaceae bacterium]|nr:sulfotransferase domain-containing protein [Gloeobacterales cyanobacterium ES-bin-141]
MPKSDDHLYLIIGGTTKAATTSLFAYLKEHPQVCGANIKETRFFLDSDYPLPSKYRLEDGLAKYEEFFCECQDTRVRLEATPDYLYSSVTPKSLQDSLPAVKLVFILREPTSRIISWYTFAQQIGQLSQDITLDEYVNQQLQNDSPKTKQHLRALEQGRYYTYLRPYLEVFGKENIHIILYEDLSKDPASVLDALCKFVGIDSKFYTGYDFKVFNSTQAMKNPGLHQMYTRVRFKMRNFVHNQAGIRTALRTMRAAFEPLYLRLNAQPLEKPEFSPAVKAMLNDYYKQENQALSELLGRPIPWQAASSRETSPK